MKGVEQDETEASASPDFLWQRLYIIAVMLLTLTLVACANTGSGGKDHYVFGYTSMTQNNPFFIVLEEAIREKVEANGDELITLNPAMDVALQINQVEDMIAQGIDAIFLNPVDWEGIRPALQMLKDAGIPIINYDTEVKDFEYVTAYVGSDNKNAGA